MMLADLKQWMRLVPSKQAKKGPSLVHPEPGRLAEAVAEGSDRARPLSAEVVN